MTSAIPVRCFMNWAMMLRRKQLVGSRKQEVAHCDSVYFICLSLWNTLHTYCIPMYREVNNLLNKLKFKPDCHFIGKSSAPKGTPDRGKAAKVADVIWEGTCLLMPSFHCLWTSENQEILPEKSWKTAPWLQFFHTHGIVLQSKMSHSHLDCVKCNLFKNKCWVSWNVQFLGMCSVASKCPHMSCLVLTTTNVAIDNTVICRMYQHKVDVDMLNVRAFIRGKR